MTPLVLALMMSALPVPALTGTDGPHSLADEVRAHELTVVFFWSPECPVVRAHDARLIDLAKTFGARGVHFLAVDSQADATLAHAQAAIASRGYPFPIVIDEASSWADALEVRFSATVVVIDRTGHVRYRGGLDSNRVKLSDDAVPLAKNALEQLLAGHEPAQKDTKALGCVLRRR